MRAATLMAVGLLGAGVTFSSFAESTVTEADGILTYNVPDGETYVEDEPFPATVQTVIKTGSGTLEVTGVNSDRTDLTLEIRAGYVKTAVCPRPFGNPATVKVLKGAALWYTGANPGQVASLVYNMEIAGDGPDGKGAFYRTGSSGGDQMITNLKLTDGATIGGDKRFGVRYTDLNFNTLTNSLKGGSDNPFLFYYGVYGASVKNPGNIVQLSDKVTIQSLGSWGDVTDDHRWTIAKSAAISFYSEKVPFPWLIDAEDSLTLIVHGNATMTRGVVGLASGKALEIYSDVSEPRSLEINGAVTNLLLRKKTDSLSVTMKGSDHFFTAMDIQGGVLDITGGSRQQLTRAWNTSTVKNGSALRLKDAGDVSTYASYLTLCNSAHDENGKVSTLEVSGDTRWSSLEKWPTADYLYSKVYLGEQRNVYSDESAAAEGWGQATISDGAVVSNCFQIGTKGVGALHLESAELYHGNNWLNVASGGRYGALCTSNSLLTVADHFVMAASEGSQAHYVQLGGTARQKTCAARIGGGGYANFYVGEGGWYDMATTYPDPNGVSYFNLGYVGSNATETGGESVLTVDGCATCEVGRIHFLARTNYVSCVNMNRGGCLAGSQMWYSSNHSRSEDSRLLFSFNGGVLKYRSTWGSQTHFLGDKPDRIVIHELGGEIMIRENTGITCSTPLERPVGKSVKSITLPSDADFLAATNIGPARIVIEGVGEGATAFASFDRVKGVLGKVIVTSPGTGYDDTTKAFVCIPKYPDRRFECTVELMEEEGGDFVKSGEGGLVLGCTNTYAGATIVKGGALTASSHWAFPSNTLLRIESGTVQLGKYKAFFECVEGVSGNVRCYLSPDKIINVRRLSLNASEAITFAEGVKMRVHGPWKISAADVAAAAGKTPGYSCPVEFTDTATIEFDGTEGLSKEMSPYTLCELADGVQFTGRPTLVKEEALGERWALSMSGSSIRLKYRNPFALIVR